MYIIINKEKIDVESYSLKIIQEIKKELSKDNWECKNIFQTRKGFFKGIFLRK